MLGPVVFDSLFAAECYKSRRMHATSRQSRLYLFSLALIGFIVVIDVLLS